MPKVFKSTCWKLWCLSTCKKSTSSLTFFGDIVKTLQTCYFGNFGNAWPFPSKIIVSTCRKLSYLFACKISTSSLTSFLWYCKERANLLFWVIWACLQKIKKNCLGTILGHLRQNLGKNEFPWKKELHQFLNILIICHCAKNRKKLMGHSWEKCWTDGQRDR